VFAALLAASFLHCVGSAQLAMLIVGILLLDVGVQGSR